MCNDELYQVVPDANPLHDIQLLPMLGHKAFKNIQCNKLLIYKHLSLVAARLLLTTCLRVHTLRSIENLIRNLPSIRPLLESVQQRLRFFGLE